MELPHWIHNFVLRASRHLPRRRRPLRLILLYHSVGGDLRNSIPSRSFKEQLRILSRERVRLLENWPENLESVPERLFSITFDDGHRDNYTIAAPLLEKFDLRGTFYVNYDTLGETPTLHGEQQPKMTERQVRSLRERGHEIGSHGLTHRRLTNLPHEEAVREILQSHERISELLGESVSTFAYPYGEYDDRLRDVMETSPYSRSVTIREGPVEPYYHPHELPRVWIHKNLSLPAFEAKCSTALRTYLNLKDRLKEFLGQSG